MKLGLVAGGGDLPVALAEACTAAGRPLFVLRLRGFADPAALARFPGEEVGIAELGRIFALLREAGCGAVCLAGQVKRPDFSALKPDLRGLRSLPAAIAAARKGDDALLRFLVAEFEGEGFTVEGADQVHAGLTLPPGLLGRHAPGPEHQADLAQALAAARTVGALDIGQAVVVAGGVMLAVEAQEGTDAMLARCAALPATLRGTADARCGVLVKWPKPIQERRVDLPTLGPATVEGAAAAGLAGIAAEAGGLLVLQREAVVALADRLGLFVVGLPGEGC
ncbi:LpxI family protein [Caulobacter sp. S45]|uniref:UDP-2,3-diacylglucosamine diphosphatase n=1 Tax=Caulobacter sp. S45 TaxID=1641861 RepID=UPI0015768255|nr:UDP-2,3-diacylglucosamine diphosphatase LpxI [Caulobacter sp. S45]